MRTRQGATRDGCVLLAHVGVRRVGTTHRARHPAGRPEEARVTDLQQAAQDLMDLDGALAFAYVDYRNGMILASASSVPYDLELAAAVATDFVRAKLRAAKEMGRNRRVEDILVTLSEEYHLILLSEDPALDGVFGYLALDRGRGNLALARRRLHAVDATAQL